MGWLLLALGIAAELCGSTSMKLSEGFTRLYPSVVVFLSYGASFTIFIFALKHFDLSFAYAIWAGLGIMLVSLIGMVFFKEPVNWLKLLSIGVIVVGVVLLNLSDTLVKPVRLESEEDHSVDVCRRTVGIESTTPENAGRLTNK